jgi:hypothetical protein
MKTLFQRNWYTEVRKIDYGLLQAKTSYIDTNRETVAHLTVDINTFIIKEALWEEQRPSKPIGTGLLTVTPLLGSEAYFSASAVLKETANFLNDPLAVALFAETIKGIIQSETFLLNERGFVSENDYETELMKLQSGSCRYYSNLDRITKTWFDYIGGSKRTGNLFVRFKTQSLFYLKANQYLLTGNLSDSFHEINVRIELDGTIVRNADGVLLRTPDLVCQESASLISKLQGIILKGTGKKQLANILGTGQGCVHVIDLVSDCAQILEFYDITPLS